MNFFITKSSLFRPLNTVRVVIVFFYFYVLSPGATPYGKIKKYLEDSGVIFSCLEIYMFYRLFLT